FSFGVGSSVNRYLLDRMAEVGRGTVQYMLLDEPPEKQVKRFYERIRAPVLTHIEVDWGGLEVSDQSPARIPDLFAGKPLTVLGRYTRGGSATVRVKAMSASGPVQFLLPLNLPAADEAGDYRALGRLWARSRIRELMNKMHRSRDAQLVEEVTQLALDHSLTSKYTSFVAVDEAVVQDSGRLRTHQVPVEMPEGVLHDTTIDGRITTEGRRRLGDAFSGADDVEDEADFDDDEDYRYARSMSGSAEVLVLGRSFSGALSRLRLGAGAGLGLAAGDDASGLASSLHLRADYFLTTRYALGIQGALLLPGLDRHPALINLLIQLAYTRLFGGWVELSAG
ncbi:MAG: hypothetical protein AAGC55_34595, partial [Myxococcota bacterium]